MPLFPDDNERQQVTDFFVSLNIADDKLQQLLQFVTQGVLNTDNQQSPGGQPAKQQASPAAKKPNPFQKGASNTVVDENANIIPVRAHTRRTGGFKGASLVMSSNNPAVLYDEYGNRSSTSKFARGILGDIDYKNLL